MNKKTFVTVCGLVAVVVLAASIEAQAQCAMCRATIESSLSSGESTIGAGLNKGILFLLAMPYLSISIVGYLWYRSSKKNQEKMSRIRAVIRKRLGR